MTFLDITITLGGLALFLHGLALARGGLQALAAEKLRSVVTAVTRNRLVGLLSGVAATAIIQSSTATTVMLVGFASSGVLTLAQAMTVLLGADIGTTLTVQLLSFRLSDWALLLTFAGFALRFASKRRRVSYTGELIMGFGLLFYGLKLMAQGASPLTQSQGFEHAVIYFADNPLLGVLAAAGFSVLLQGSAPAIGLLLSIAHGSAGSDGFELTLTAALPMVLGANLGTTVTPALSSIAQEVEGKRVALAHVLFKVAGICLFLPLLGPFRDLVAATSDDLARQIANAHTLFNVAVALVFLPFTSAAAKALTRFYRPPERARFGPRYLDERAIETPALAFGLATREFLRMCDIVGDMLKDWLRALEHNDLNLIDDIEARDDKVDILNREIRFYLAKMTQEEMTEEHVHRQMTLITLTSDMENAGDTINKNLVPIARKKALLGLQFSEEGMSDIALFHAKVVENFDLSLIAFSTGDEELARKVRRHRDALPEIESELKKRHILRLHRGLPESLDTSTLHLDIISYLMRINHLASDLAEAVLTGLRSGHRRGR